MWAHYSNIWMIGPAGLNRYQCRFSNSCLPNWANFVENLLLLFEFMPYMMIGGLETMKNIPYWKIQCCGNDILWSFYSDGVAVVTYKHIHYLWSKLQIITMESHMEEMVHTSQQFWGIFTYFLHSSSSILLLYTIQSVTFLHSAEFESFTLHSK